MFVPEGSERQIERLPGALRLAERGQAPAANPYRDDMAPQTGPVALFLAMAGREAEQGRFLFLLPIGLGCGTFLWYLPNEDPNVAAYAVVTPILLLISRLLRYRHPVLAMLFLFAGMTGAGVCCSAFETYRNRTVLLDHPFNATVAGRVADREALTGGRWRYRLQREDGLSAAPADLPEQVHVTVKVPVRPFAGGALVEATMHLSPPSGPALPGLNDFAFAAYFDHVGAVGYAMGEMRELVPQKAQLSSWRDRMMQWRSAIAERVRHRIPGDEGAVAAAIITNEKRAISPETLDAMRLAGLAHVIAIAGIHMALAAGTSFIVLRYLFALIPELVEHVPVKRLAALGSLVTASGYYMISGFAISAERAWLMLSAFLLAVLFGRGTVSLRNLGLSAIFILIVTPSALLGPSFQMSYAATAGLISAHNAMSRLMPFGTPDPSHHNGWRRWVGPVFRFFNGVFISSLIGTLATAPFSAAHFHRFALFGFVANLAAMPIVSFITMPMAVLSVVAMPFGFERWPLALMGWSLTFVIAIAKSVASWGGQIDIALLPPMVVPLISLGGLMLTLMASRLRYLGLVPLMAAVILLPFGPPQPDLLVAEDGGLVAMVRPAKLAVNRPEPPAFVYGQWQEALARHITDSPLERLPPSLELLSSAPDNPTDDESRQDRQKPKTDGRALRLALAEALNDPASEGHFTCRAKEWCYGKLTGGTRIISIDRAAYAGPACDLADLVISSVRLKFDSCRSGAILLTPDILARTGSLSLSEVHGHLHGQAALLGNHRPWRVPRAMPIDIRPKDGAQEKGEPEDVPPAVLALFNDSGG